MKKGLFFLSLVLLVFISCKKETAKAENSEQLLTKKKAGAVKKKKGAENYKVYDPCTDYTEFQWVNNELICTYQEVPLKLVGPFYQSICDNGNPFTVINGLRVYGYLEIRNPQLCAGIIAQPEYPSNQFSIGMCSIGADWSRYGSHVQKYNTDWQKFLLKDTAYPYMSDYIPSLADVTRVITGKVIRVTTGSGYALAPECHPDKVPVCLEVQ